MILSLYCNDFPEKTHMLMQIEKFKTGGLINRFQADSVVLITCNSQQIKQIKQEIKL
jgi:hypothetical protein